MKRPVTPGGSRRSNTNDHVHLTGEALHELRNAIHACSMFAELSVQWGYISLAEADEMLAAMRKLNSIVDDVGATSA